MAQSIFSFIRTPDFIDNMNRPTCFDVNDMDGTSLNYQIVLATNCSEKIEDNLTQYGTLNSNVTEISSDIIKDQGMVALTYSRGINNNRIISMGSTSVVVDVGDKDYYLKGLFLRDRYTGYVLAYCILQRTVPIANEVVFPSSGVVWNIRNEV